MATAAQLRRMALALPEVAEKSHFGSADFRVRNKIFAGLPAEKRGYVKLAPEAQAMLLDARPNAFSPAVGAWGRLGWTYVELPQVEVGELRELLAEAFRLVAPKRLLADPAGAGARKKTSSGTARNPRRLGAKPSK